ncbi:helix-turn-helix domain-containing protein [Kibdelosporangium phytohabitans]|uniref:helix-turn-helix domain-containing protein n=1 Tax=Kibdelosporangium phytohabitans TaxID=860235 RepID=UPI00146FEEC4|nr:helix-turn-helix transcriptional regulator [Kibdelosporangium phytohabitans]MBE1467525.1 transcriptional regulator with XRE-family HTH domain [Kibdelosporangium phytohabitans]
MDELVAQSRRRVGGLLRRYRKSAGLSIAALAAATQYSKSAIAKVEQGKGDLTVEMAREVDRALVTGGRFVAVLTEPRFFRPAQLPAISNSMVGMEAEVRQLEEWLARGNEGADTRRVMLVTGPPWIGTSTMALRVAHSACERGEFPDGQLYADLAGFRADRSPRNPREVLASFLRALGAWVAPDATLSELTQEYRTALAGREMVIVLDNATSVEQVEPLLPGPSATDCRVLVASRLSLARLTTTVAERLEIRTLPQAQLGDLLRRLLSPNHPITRRADAVSHLVDGAGGFPSVITMTAEWLTDNAGVPMSVERFEEALFSQVDGSPLRAALDASYDHVSSDAQRLFRLLGGLPNVATSMAAAAQLLDVSPARAAACLAELTAANFVRADSERGRYLQYPLLRRYGRFLNVAHDAVVDRDAARDRLLAWYLQTVKAAEQTIMANEARSAAHEHSGRLTRDMRFSTTASALAWMRAEGWNLAAVLELGAATRKYRLVRELAQACLAGLDAFVATSPSRWGTLWREVTMWGRQPAASVKDPDGALPPGAMAEILGRLYQQRHFVMVVDEVGDAWVERTRPERQSTA